MLNVYNWADYIGETTIEDFTARTGISVNYDVYSSTEEMQAKMLAGMTGYDVVNVAGTDMPRFIEPKLLMPLDRARLAELVEPRPRDPAHLRHLGPGQRLRRALHVGLGRHRLQHGHGRASACPTPTSPRSTC